MLIPGGSQFHPSIITIMGPINQTRTGYDAVSVCGPQIFEPPVLSVRKADYLTLGNSISYFLTITLAWMTIGRRKLMVWGATGLATSFLLLTVIADMATSCLRFSPLAFEIPVSIFLYTATAIFGILLALYRLANLYRDLSQQYPRPSQRYLRNCLGPGEFCSHAADAHRVQKYQILADPRLCGDKYFRGMGGLTSTCRERRPEL
jgi:hypothetical protein